VFNVTDTWPLITVKTQGQPAEDVVTTPAESPFRYRLIEYGSLAIAWDLLNGRFVRRPPLHRAPPPKFESKQHERLDGLRAWMWRAKDSAASSKLHQRLRKKRKNRLQSEREREYWWGDYAKMRIPARKGMAALNRRAGFSVEPFIQWKPRG
jgi:hypothetical protein